MTPESEAALKMLHNLMQYDFGHVPLDKQLGQVNQGYNLTADMIEALAKQSDDPRLDSLAALIRQSWGK